jgi:fructose-specific phosphotransferase system IIC component
MTDTTETDKTGIGRMLPILLIGTVAVAGAFTLERLPDVPSVG